MRKPVFIAAGLLLFGLTAAWHFVLVPRWIQRIPVGWQWEASYIGYQTVPDQTGRLPLKDTVTIYSHVITVLANSRQPHSVELDDRYSTRDIVSGKVNYEYNYSAEVDPGTGAHLKPEYRGDYFLFPRNVERKTYSLRFSYLKGIPVVFQREEEVAGLNTYLFAYRGRGEYTESFAGTAEFPGIQVKPGQEIKCADDQFVFKAWVEPVTGAIIRVEETCLASDYVYDIATGQQLAVVDRWAGETAGNDVISRVAIASQQRRKLLWQQRYIPSGLLLAGLLCCGFALLPKKAVKNEDV
jgi:Porin PorA